MNGSELLKKLRKLAKQKGVDIRIEKHHGKGSHATLYFGDRRTTIKDRKKELGIGLLNSMLENLGIDKDEI
jgi:mRNA interferase HicA